MAILEGEVRLVPYPETGTGCMQPIKLLIVDDSFVASRYLSRVFAEDPDFEVLDIARNGIDGIQMAVGLKPDIICMDINMPDMDGFEATRRIMAISPTPIVIVSSTYDPKLVSMSFKALDAGALAIFEKPPAGPQPEFVKRRQELLSVFKAMAGMRRIPATSRLAPPRTPVNVTERQIAPARTRVSPRIVAIGASTGGPQAIQTVLRALPKEFPLPIVIVQHITKGFAAGFANWLRQTTCLDIRIAADGDVLNPGSVYVGPESIHIEVHKDGRIHLVNGPQEHGVCPAASRLFRSVLAAYGPACIAVLLSGMGKDGAAELKALYDAKAMTIAQDRETSVVHGMPGEAIRLGGAGQILPSGAIGSAVCELVAKNTRKTQ